MPVDYTRARPRSCDPNASDSKGDEIGEYTYPGDRKSGLEVGITRDPRHLVWNTALGWIRQKQARYGPTVDGQRTIYVFSGGGFLVAQSGAYHIVVQYFRAKARRLNEQQAAKVLGVLLTRMSS